MGKKAAQSEVGKKAGRAAVKGACDSARDDMMDRYFGPGGETTPTPAPAAKSPSRPEAPAPSSSKSKQESKHSYSSSSSSTVGGQGEWNSDRPPKPSLFNKLKFSKGSSSQARPRPHPAKKKVYKHRLAQSADWERLPMAQALFNFKGEMKCDLEFRKGQVIQVITRTDTQDDWWEGKLEDRVGIFPANYVKMM